MKNYINKSIFSLLILLGLNFFALAQKPSTDAEVLGKIALTSYIPEQVEGLPKEAENLLLNKLNQITSENGLVAAPYDSRFIITANINVMTKDFLSTAPPMNAVTLDVTFYIGDGYDGKKYASKTITVKGVGTNETTAYIEALAQITPNEESIQSFVSNGKSKIINYYNSQCQQIMKEVNILQAQNKYDEAMFMLAAIPGECTECYNEAAKKIAPMYSKMINKDCKTKLAEASSLWAANQDVDTANKIGEILNSIDPESSCFNDVKALSEKISKHIFDLQQKEWDYKIETDVNLKRDLINAYKDIGVANGNGQPKSVVYNVKGWF